MALQEIKLKSGEVNQIGSYILFCSGGDNRRLGTDFLVYVRFKTAIVKFKAVSDKMCLLRMRGKYKKISFNIDAPTEVKQMEKKEEFIAN